MKKITILLVLFLLIGCSKTPESQKVFETLMTTFQSGDSKQIVKLSNKDFSGNTFDEAFFNNSPFYLEHFKKIKYKIIEVKETKDTSTIKVSIEAPDLFEYAPEVFKEIMMLAFSGANEEVTPETINKSFEEILQKKDLKYTSEEVIVNMLKKDGKWIIDDSSADFNAFYSLLVGGFDKMNENFGSEE